MKDQIAAGAGAVRTGLAGIVIAAVVFAALFGFNRINETEVAVKRNPVTGAVSSTPYRQGLYHSILRSWVRSRRCLCLRTFAA